MSKEQQIAVAGFSGAGDEHHFAKAGSNGNVEVLVGGQSDELVVSKRAPLVVLVDGEVVDYTEFVRPLFSKRNDGREGLLHAAIGVSGELAELLDSAKKHWVYGRERDIENEIEELGDAEFYFEAAQIVIFGGHVNLEESIMAEVIAEQAERCGYMNTVVSANIVASGLLEQAYSLAVDSELASIEVTFDHLLHVRASLDACYAACGFKRQVVLAHNVRKLRKRYPSGKYTDAAALARADKAAS